MYLKSLLCLFFLIYLSSVAANEKLPRTILALYSPQEGKAADLTRIHRFAEMPLNYLGFKVVYWNIHRGLPSKELSQDCRAIFSWFVGKEGSPQPIAYCQWLLEQFTQGKKVIIWGELGVEVFSQKGEQLVAEVYRKLGLKYSDTVISNSQLIQLFSQNSKLVGWERKIHRYPQFIEGLEPVAQANVSSHLVLQLANSSKRCHAIVTGETGGMALDNYIIYYHRTSETAQWLIEPFLFFEKALDCAGWPRPDTSFAQGHRLAFCSIDGDGFINLSEVDPEKSAAMVLYDRVFQRYTFPITISLVVAEVAEDILGNPKIMDDARKIFQLPHVEPACHGYAHPSDWENQVVSYPNLPNYIFSYRKETQDAIAYLDTNIFPAHRSTQIYLWTGDCRPPAKAVAILEKMNMPHMNGGNPRWDSFFPSVTSVSPWARPVGPYRQTYACAGNEYLYTDGWQSHFRVFRQVIESWENMDKKRLLRPVHLYYHFYIADKIPGLQSLFDIYSYLEKQNYTWIFASHYPRIVQGFFQAQLFSLTPKGWKIQNYGPCRTLRWDNARELFPDLKRCEGVMGFSHRKGHLYVYLDKKESAKIFVSNKPPSGQTFLVQSSALISNWQVDQEKISFAAEGLGTKRFVLYVANGGKFKRENRVISSNNKNILFWEEEIAGKTKIVLERQ